jgi:hypothetical protein
MRVFEWRVVDMTECKVICDRCRAEENVGFYPSIPTRKGWKDVKVQLDQYNHKTFALCPKCLSELKLVNEQSGQMEKISDPSIQQKVFDLLLEIANIAIEERGV